MSDVAASLDKLCVAVKQDTTSMHVHITIASWVNCYTCINKASSLVLKDSEGA